MILAFDIERNVRPIFRNVSRNTLTGDKNLGESLDDLIFIIEGMISHIPELDKEETKKLLEKTSKVSKTLIETDEGLVLNKYFGNQEIENKFQYLLKTISKFKSLLRISYTKDVTVKETPADLKEAISNISREPVYKAKSKKQ